MAFAAYLLENAMLVLALGRVFGHFLCSTVGVLDEPKKKKKKKNARGKVGWARLELPEPLLTKQKVKMAGYWPSSSVRFYGPSRGQ